MIKVRIYNPAKNLGCIYSHIQKLLFRPRKISVKVGGCLIKQLPLHKIPETEKCRKNS